MKDFYTTQIELGPLLLEIDIEYRMSRRIEATWDDPAEGGEPEIDNIIVELVTGETYQKERRDLGDWALDLDRLAEDYIEEHLDMQELIDHAVSLERDF